VAIEEIAFAVESMQILFVDDPVFKELSSKAVCTPDCCPKSAKK